MKDNSAYIGDSVFDLVVRTILTKRANRPVFKLNQLASSIVCATSQAKLMAAILPLLDEQEAAIYKRGRNASPGSMAKNASVQDYLTATGLEALTGWLYLNGHYPRLLTLIDAGLAKTGMAKRLERNQEK